jgi:hypothetical protein
MDDSQSTGIICTGQKGEATGLIHCKKGRLPQPMVFNRSRRAQKVNLIIHIDDARLLGLSHGIETRFNPSGYEVFLNGNCMDMNEFLCWYSESFHLPQISPPLCVTFRPLTQSVIVSNRPKIQLVIRTLLCVACYSRIYSA